jgi:hypothetical protein
MQQVSCLNAEIQTFRRIEGYAGCDCAKDSDAGTHIRRYYWIATGWLNPFACGNDLSCLAVTMSLAKPAPRLSDELDGAHAMPSVSRLARANRYQANG